jgi:hypothetical protein
MSLSIHRESVVGPDGTITLTVPELAPGQRVTVTIESDQAAPTAETPEAPIHIIDLIKDLPGHRLFKSAEEVDEYLRQERASWDR